MSTFSGVSSNCSAEYRPGDPLAAAVISFRELNLRTLKLTSDTTDEEAFPDLLKIAKEKDGLLNREAVPVKDAIVDYEV